jgi:hypothetical protein
MAEPDPIVDQAMALAAASDAGTGSHEAAQELAATGDRAGLERAQAELVRLVHRRSDDYQATAALSLVNKALATVGWPNPYSWKHRRKP